MPRSVGRVGFGNQQRQRGFDQRHFPAACLSADIIRKFEMTESAARSAAITMFGVCFPTVQSFLTDSLVIGSSLSRLLHRAPLQTNAVCQVSGPAPE